VGFALVSRVPPKGWQPRGPLKISILEQLGVGGLEPLFGSTPVNVGVKNFSSLREFGAPIIGRQGNEGF